MRRVRAAQHRRTSEAMTLEELEHRIDHLDPPPLIDGVSMLDGYLATIIVGPCPVSPYEWMGHMLRPHDNIGMEGSTQAAAIMGVAARFNAVSEGLATSAPLMERFRPAPGARASWQPRDSVTRPGDRSSISA
jgi:hypothetical protein